QLQQLSVANSDGAESCLKHRNRCLGLLDQFSLLAKTAAYSTSCSPDPALSRAGSLPQCSVLTNDLVAPQIPCGSELARECGGTFNIFAD
ncbi:hypothetical protein, partial [Pseudomonas atacamensis]|uniref:hypothetical protein n=1 Tax=Pseudomonas atacamensis TaxID=2565368 RepID=UPI0038110F01